MELAVPLAVHHAGQSWKRNALEPSPPTSAEGSSVGSAQAIVPGPSSTVQLAQSKFTPVAANVGTTSAGEALPAQCCVTSAVAVPVVNP